MDTADQKVAPKRMTMSVPDDQLFKSWWKAQLVPSVSIRWLVHRFVAEYGMGDVMALALATGTVLQEEPEPPAQPKISPRRSFNPKPKPDPEPDPEPEPEPETVPAAAPAPTVPAPASVPAEPIVLAPPVARTSVEQIDMNDIFAH